MHTEENFQDREIDPRQENPRDIEIDTLYLVRDIILLCKQHNPKYAKELMQCSCELTQEIEKLETLDEQDYLNHSRENNGRAAQQAMISLIQSINSSPFYTCSKIDGVISSILKFLQRIVETLMMPISIYKKRKLESFLVELNEKFTKFYKTPVDDKTEWLTVNGGWDKRKIYNKYARQEKRGYLKYIHEDQTRNFCEVIASKTIRSILVAGKGPDSTPYRPKL